MDPYFLNVMTLNLVAIGKVDGEEMMILADTLRQVFSLSCHVMPVGLDPGPSFHWERKQHHSSELLYAMQNLAGSNNAKLLGVANVDLYIPILTFVFGEAQMSGACAVISTYRLRQEFYGLPADTGLLRDRVTKEAVHELGHTFGLVHCEDYECAMASSHSVEWIDLKGKFLCVACQKQLASAGNFVPDATRF